MAGLKDAYKNKSSEGYKDVFKEQSRKSGDYTSTPIEALRKPSKKNGGKVEQLSGIFKNKKSDDKIQEEICDCDNEKTTAEPSRSIKVVYALKVKWKIWTVCFCFIYIIFLIYGVTKTSYQYDSKGYSVPVAMKYDDIKKAEEYKSLLTYYEKCKLLYEKVLETDYELAVNPDNSQIIATKYESVLDEIDAYLTQLDATTVKSDYSLLKNMLYNWCANDIAIYLQNIAEALTVNSQTKAEQAITYRAQSKVDFDTITQNFSSVGKTMKGIDVSSFEDWTPDGYYKELEEKYGNR